MASCVVAMHTTKPAPTEECLKDPAPGGQKSHGRPDYYAWITFAAAGPSTRKIESCEATSFPMKVFSKVPRSFRSQMSRTRHRALHPKPGTSANLRVSV
mmetsp:Transcript_84567/g.261719  ORF Transcript_84567/g.261719 Transcript_84567/m.261719 type:complete len:99 (-) Transcript_84567:1159-1455(-)